jgi:large subunit ribosomal protein L25
MKEFNLLGKTRETKTKGELNELRNQGFVPGNVYGSEETIGFYCFINDLRDLIYSSDVFRVNIKIEGKIYKTIMKEIQFHPLKDIPIHIDLMEVTEDRVIKILYPISFKGSPIGARQGGKLYKKIRMLHLKGKVKDMPNELEIDISNLNLGDSVKVKDLKFKNIEILDQQTATIVSISRTRISDEPAEVTPEAPAAESAE